MVFSERLTELLGASRGGATRLSEAMRVSKSTVSDWKNGRKEPSMENIVALANYFSVTTDYLLCMSTANEKKPSPGISKNGREMLALYEKLPERKQVLLLGRLQEMTTPLLDDCGEKNKVSASGLSGEKAV